MRMDLVRSFIHLISVVFLVSVAFLGCSSKGGGGDSGDSGTVAPAKISFTSPSGANIYITEGQSSTLIIPISGSLDHSTTVSYTIDSGSSDFPVTSESVIVAAGQSSLSIGLAPLDDSLQEGPETFNFTLTGPPDDVSANLALVVHVVDHSILSNLSGTPTGRSQINPLNVTVNGSDLVGYKYKVGATSATVCTESAGYGSEVTIGSNITASLSGISDGGVTLCVLGKTSTGLWQDVRLATQSSWTKDTTVPSILGLAADSTYRKSKSFTWSCAADDTCTYRYLIDQNPITDISGLSYAAGSTASQASGTGDYYLHIQAKDSVNLESSVSHIQFKLDNTPPNAPVMTEDGAYLNSLSTSPMTFFDPAVDAHSGIGHYEYAVGDSPGASNVKSWTSLSTSLPFQATGLSLLADQTYYVSVRTLDASGNVSSSVTSLDGWVVDMTAPSPPALMNDGFLSNSVADATFDWSAGDDALSGIAYYEVAIGSSAGATNVLGWTNVGLNLSGTVAATLTRGQTYYGSVRCRDLAGNISSATNGDGFIPIGSYVYGNKLVASPLTPRVRETNKSAQYGYAVAMNEDGSLMAIGAPYDDLDESGENYKYNAGAVLVYSKDGGGNWSLDAKIAAPSCTNCRNADDNFGFSVALSGSTLVVGAPYQDYDASGSSVSSNAGAIYIYEKSGTWSFQTKIVGSGTNGRVAGDSFGISVGISSGRIAVGAHGQDYDEIGASAITDAGAVYIYSGSLASWSLTERIVPSGNRSRNSADYFGRYLALSGNILAVTSPRYDWDADGNNMITDSGGAFIYKHNGSAFVQNARLVPPDDGSGGRQASDQFGSAIDTDGTTVVVGSPYHNLDLAGATSLGDAGASYVWTWDTSQFIYSQKLIASGTNARLASDQFGYAVTVSGNHIVIGSRLQDYNAAGASAATDAGALYHFTKSGTWSLSSKIIANNRVSYDYFGSALDSAMDGSDFELSAGAPLHDFANLNALNIPDAGAAFILRYNGSWTALARATEESVVPAGNNRTGHQLSALGSAIVVSDDQNWMFVGAPEDNYDSTQENFSASAGAVYVYKKTSSWTYHSKITPPNPVQNRRAWDYFGTSLATSGNTLVVGAPRNDYDSTNVTYNGDAGAIFVFDYNSGNDTWDYTTKITPTGTNAWRSSDYFGQSVAIKGDYLAVGAYYQDYDADGANVVSNNGAVYTFKRTTGVWAQLGKLVATGTSARVGDDYFGFSLTMSSDYLFVGAYNQDTNASGSDSQSNAGAVFVFSRSGDTFTQTQKLVGVGTNGRVAGDIFGYALSVNGTRLAVGAPGNDFDATGNNALSDAGAVFIFLKSGSTWSIEKRLVGFGTNGRMNGDNFGRALAFTGDLLTVGAPYQDYDENGLNSVSNAGAAYVFLKSSGVWTSHQKLAGQGTNGRMPDDYFGWSCGSSSGALGVGAKNHDFNASGTEPANNAGTVFTYVY